MLYGIYEVGKREVFVFMGERTYQRAYFFDIYKANEICANMNANENKYEVRRIA